MPDLLAAGEFVSPGAGCEREDALELTQELLADFCDDGGLERVTPEDGSLRRDVSAKKRGGGQFVLSLEEVDFAHHLACGYASPTGNSCMTGAWIHGILSF